MTKVTYLILITLVLSALSGCGSVASGAKFQDYQSTIQSTGSTANVIVFRPDRVTGSGDTMLIFANGESKGELLPVGFLAFDIPIKDTTLHTDTAGIDRQYALQPKAGETYYFITEFSNYVMTGAWDLVPTTDSSTISDMSELKESVKP
ncbi:hypothetical protein SIN8267_02678 [Sinobacterium norvegicum]|uniref:Lipoprotein n=1 Tax=Sinobacterium norvegicum TaxID=1641715 RepID=A0ABM9AH52_9GAMM|nr:DUF2846 domain-containing protein [Sinobacterium norvegicum]CAH0992545.1 hypothetical protein SIN8267_02678 [Sinobacterium norvegicum]